MGVTPPPALFVQEHVTAPENRLNLALFALLNVREFREWFLSRLDFPADSVVYPPQDTAGVRPDLVVVDEGGRVSAWIEVELGAPDEQQLKQYRSAFPERVLCIPGTEGGDLSLGEIADRVRQFSAEDKQHEMSARVLVDLIDRLASKTQPLNYADPDDAVRRERLVAAVVDRTQDRVTFAGPPLPGQIWLATITQKGWTLRVYSHRSSAERSVSVMWNRAIGRGEVRVPSKERLARLLPSGAAAASYVGWLESFGVNVSALRERQSAPILELALLERVDELVDRLGALAAAG